MAYDGLTITTAVVDENKSSHCIPAYPQYTSATTFDDAFYTSRQDTNDALAGTTIVYTEVS